MNQIIPPDYKKEDIQKFVKNYPLDEKNTGLGTLFIVEYFNKNIKEASTYFVVINMQTKEVLLHEKIISKPVGNGVRNYWGGAIFNAIQKIKKEEVCSLVRTICKSTKITTLILPFLV